MLGTHRKTASRRSLRNPIRCFDQAASAAAFRFLRQPSRLNAPRPVAKSGRAAGRGVAEMLGVVIVNVESSTERNAALKRELVSSNTWDSARELSISV
jgi:hypothetical protein